VVNAILKVDDFWEPGPGTWIKPFDGWGYSETIDGDLAGPFEVRIDETAVDIGGGILGWRGSVVTPGHKYAGMPFWMDPRHTTWTGIVVINVGDDDAAAFSGMAETRGLECDWL
jgi:hypothetical protein